MPNRCRVEAPPRQVEPEAQRYNKPSVRSCPAEFLSLTCFRVIPTNSGQKINGKNAIYLLTVQYEQLAKLLFVFFVALVVAFAVLPKPDSVAPRRSDILKILGYEVQNWIGARRRGGPLFGLLCWAVIGHCFRNSLRECNVRN